MTDTREMLDAHPVAVANSGTLATCIEACFDCAKACTICADACLSEEMVDELRMCIRTDLDCADICTTTGRILARQTPGAEAIVRAQIDALRQAVRACARECEKHAEKHDHCRICAEACRRCEAACEDLLGEPAVV